MSDKVTGETPHERRAELDLLRRMERLEHENQRLRRHGMTMLVTLAIILGLATALIFVSGRTGLPGSVADVVTSRQFQLRDRQGTVRGAWGLADDGSVRMVFNDGRGKPRIRLSLLEDGSSGLSFADSADHRRVVLGVLPDHATSLALADRGGTPRTVLGVSPDGSANLVFADRGGSTRAALGLDGRGIGILTLADRAGRDLVDEPAGAQDPVPEDTATSPVPARTSQRRR